MAPRRLHPHGVSYSQSLAYLLLAISAPALFSALSTLVLTSQTFSNHDESAAIVGRYVSQQAAEPALSPNVEDFGTPGFFTGCHPEDPEEATKTLVDSPLCCLARANQTFCECDKSLFHYDYGNAPRCSITLVDAWAGISSFSDGFSNQTHVTVDQFYWIENHPDAVSLLKNQYPHSVGSVDFYKYDWQSWIPKSQGSLTGLDDLVVVVAGPSCCHLSVAGKRLRQHDYRSLQGLHTAELAVRLNACTLVIENVTNFVYEDGIHGLLSEIEAFLDARGYAQHCVLRVLDSSLGGFTSRERVFVVWESTDMSSRLQHFPLTVPNAPPRALKEVLSPIANVEHLVLPGQFIPKQRSTGSCSKPLYAGSFTFGGPSCPWIIGCACKLPFVQKYDTSTSYSPNKIWRLIQEEADFVRVFDDVNAAPQFRWVHKSKLYDCNKVALSWPVYSIDAVAKPVRSSNFAPGDLILDTRISECAVRCFSAEEKWKLQGLSDHKLASFIENGVPEESVIGRAGNSIPATMVNSVTKIVGSRVAAYSDLLDAQRRSAFRWLQPGLNISSPALCITWLVIISSSQPHHFLVMDGKLPGLVHKANQQQATSIAATWATTLGAMDSADVCFPMERPCGCGIERAIICPQNALWEPLQGHWLPLDNLWESPGIDLLVTAASRVDCHLNSTQFFSSSWATGRVGGKAAYQHEAEVAIAGAPDSSQWRAAVEDCLNGEEELKAKLLADSSEHAEYLRSWVDIATPLDVSDLPDHLHTTFEPAEKDWCDLAKDDPHAPICTKYLPLPAPHGLSPRPAPLGWLSAVVPSRQGDAKHMVQSFCKGLTAWLAGEGLRPKTQVIPPSWLEPWIFEAPHEFYSRPGYAVPVDLSTPLPTHLALDFLLPLIRDYPDQEIVSFVELGVRYKADLEPVILLQPHLFSFLDVQDKFLKEADRFAVRGWTQLFDCLPCVPFRCTACGSTCRPLEPNRPRCTNDAGAPRCECYADGVQVLSLNDAIDMGDVPLPKEIKPRSVSLLVGIRILKEAAAVLGEKIFMLTDDFASFFNQLRLAPEEIWKTGVMHPPRKGQEGVSFALDRVLGFGVRMASNVAQRFANMIIHVFKTEMDKMEADDILRLRDASPCFERWCKHRESLGDFPIRLYHVLVYTDDPVWIILSADRVARALKLWHWLTSGAGLLMAIPEKRSMGTSGGWLGIKYLVDLGFSVVPAQKVLRACIGVDLCLSLSMSFADYRRLVGFLEHVRDVLFLRGDKMYGLYAPHIRELEPAHYISTPYLTSGQLDLVSKQMVAWKDRLLGGAASSVRHVDAFLSGKAVPQLEHPRCRLFTVFSDACKEGASIPGLGGWIVGFFWIIPLTAFQLEMHITHLEALAAVINIIVTEQIFGGHDSLPADTRICEETDALATAHVLIRGKARSPMMQHIHTEALQIKQFRGMLPFLEIKHITGLANLAADAASRSKLDALRALARQLGMKAVQVDVPQAALDLIQSAAMKFHQLKPSKRAPDQYEDPPLDIHNDGDVHRHPGPKATYVKSRGRPAEANKVVSKTTFGAYKAGVPLKLPHAQHRPYSRAPLISSFSCATDLAVALSQDDSPYAICGGDFSLLLEACENSFSTADKAYALSTSKADAGHWRAWEGFCEHMNTTPWRADHRAATGEDHLGRLREKVLMDNALLFFMRTRKPRSLADKSIKPQSALNILIGMQRVLKRNHLSVVPLSTVALSLKGLMRDFIQKYGPTSLVQKRREPVTNGIISSLVNLPEGTPLGSQGALTWGDRTGKSTRLAITLAAATGFRSAELFRTNEETYFLQCASLSWRVAGVDLAAPITDAELHQLDETSFLVVTPVPSKSDQFNQHWGALPIYIPYRHSERNAAWAAKDLLLHTPDRQGALLRDNNGAALSQRFMKTRLHHMLGCFMPPAQVRVYSWHSFRSGLACMLLACNVKPSTIMAMLRWRSEESLRAYARLNPAACASLLDRAALACVASVQTSNLPITEQFDLFLSLHQMHQQL